MIPREISEIRRRIAPDKNDIRRFYGCYVDAHREVISEFDNSVVSLSQTENELYLAQMRKILSGSVGRSLINVEFATEQVVDSPEHTMLMTLRDTACEDEDARKELFRRIIEGFDSDGGEYVILLAADTYDVPKKGHDVLGDGESETVFRYFLCAVCPVKEGKTELEYFAADRNFRGFATNQAVKAPVKGFMFPTFDDRAANIYNVQYYSRDVADIGDRLVKTLFNTAAPMSCADQRDSFGYALNEGLGGDCSFELVADVHERLRDKIEERKESGDPYAAGLSAGDLGEILRDHGVEDEAVQSFTKACSQTFGSNRELDPSIIIDAKHFSVETPHVKVTVDPDYSFTLETRTIEGRKYLLVPADEGVSINGIPVK